MRKSYSIEAVCAMYRKSQFISAAREIVGAVFINVEVLEMSYLLSHCISLKLYY